MGRFNYLLGGGRHPVEGGIFYHVSDHPWGRYGNAELHRAVELDLLFCFAQIDFFVAVIAVTHHI
jgi:hypothetical protein